MKKMKWYATKDGINLYDLFSAGIAFGYQHKNHQWTEEEWLAALDAALPKDWDEAKPTVRSQIAAVKEPRKCGEAMSW